jgi:IS5 family transposase
VLDELIDFKPLVEVVDKTAPRKRPKKGGRPPYPTEVMLRIIILKHLNNLSNDQMEFMINDRMSFLLIRIQVEHLFAMNLNSHSHAS